MEIKPKYNVATRQGGWSIIETVNGKQTRYAPFGEDRKSANGALNMIRNGDHTEVWQWRNANERD